MKGIVEGYPLKMSTAKVACYLETANVRVCAHSPTMFATRNEVYSEFVNAVLDEF